MTNKADWQGRTGESWAAEWARTDRSFGGLTDHLFSLARTFSARHILDIGCGAGELSLALARSHPKGIVHGIDISEKLIDAARGRGGHHHNAIFHLADAASWSMPNFQPDLLVSRHGVMFFDDPVAAFTHLHSLAAPNARLLFSCFRSADENPWVTGVTGLLPPGSIAPSAPFAPGPFAFADRDHVHRILKDASWQNIEIAPFDFAYIAGAGGNAVDDAVSFFQNIGPAARAIRGLTADDKEQFLARLREYLDRHERSNLVALRAAAWIVNATAK